MDNFADFIDSYLVTKSKILREIDEETAYIYYLAEAYQLPEFDLELRKAYHSPVRDTKPDEKPSFSVFENTRQQKQLEDYGYSTKYLWKDSGKSTNNVGNIFNLVGLLYNLSTEQEIFEKIDADFGLGLYPSNNSINYTIVKPLGKIIPKQPSYIRIKSKPFTTEAIAYWLKYGVTRDLLEKHEVTQVQYFWTDKEQEQPYTPKSLCFAYKVIWEDEETGKKEVYYKLYTPGAVEYKFINDYPDDLVEGWNQLDYTQNVDICIITKSKKDVMVLASLGYQAVSPKSETTMIQSGFIHILQAIFKRVFILFDNDLKHNGDRYHNLYNLPLIYIPLSSGTKDISDYREKYSGQAARDLLAELTREY